MVAHNSRTSIIILNCNGITDTRACLRSLLDDASADTEIIVLDNGSNVDEAAVLRAEFGKSISVKRSEENRGYAGGNNYAETFATGEFIVFLNNDTQVTRGWLKPLLGAMRSDERIGACQPKMLSLLRPGYFDAAGACGGFIDSLGFLYLRGRAFSTVEKDVGQYDDTCEVDYACGACMMMRRQVFIDSGGFDARLFAYMEEVDLCWRLRSKGLRMLCIPQSVVYHKGGQTWKHSTHRKLYHKHRNSLLVLAKHLRGWQAVRILCTRLALEWVASVYYVLHGDASSSLAPIRSFFMFFWLAPGYIFAKYSCAAAPLSDVRLLREYFVRGRRTYSDIVSDH